MRTQGIGDTALAILRELKDGAPKHGYALIKTLNLNSGMIYPTLSTLERRGLIKRLEWEAQPTGLQGAPKRPVQITDLGKRLFAALSETTQS